MRKQVYILTLILLLLITTVNAEQINIILKSPGDGSVTTAFTQDFIFSFDQDPDMINCSLIVDDEEKEVRNTLIQRNSNKMNIELESGTHAWFIKCYDTEFNKILSETRSLTVNVGGGIKQDYEIIYNANGLRSYIITIAPGQDAVELPAMKAGEDIQIKINAKTHYLDIIKMGSDVSTSFVEIRDRTSNTIHRMLAPSTLSFDFYEDDTADIELFLRNVERNINAYFIVTPYPGAVVEEPEEVEEEPEVIEEEPVEEEEPVGEVEEPEEVISEEEIKEEEPAEEEPEEAEPMPEKKSKTWLTLLIIVIILIIVLVIILTSKSRKKVKKVKVKKKKKQEKKKQVKGVKEKKEKISKKEPEEAVGVEKEKKEESKSLEPEEDWPILTDKFDIIKSTGKKMKK
nr:hypothetical protein [Nanoarchaeota archaeon]